MKKIIDIKILNLLNERINKFDPLSKRKDKRQFSLTKKMREKKAEHEISKKLSKNSEFFLLAYFFKRMIKERQERELTISSEGFN